MPLVSRLHDVPDHDRLLAGVDHLPNTYNREQQAFSRGEPEWGAHLADDLERIVALHDASTIAAVIVGVSGVSGDAGGYLAIAAAIVSVHLVVMLVLRYATYLIRILGAGGITLLAKIAGLLLAAIAVQLIADSIAGFVAQGT